MDKPFNTYTQQLQKLKDRGLLVPNDTEAKLFLQKENYYTVINGYNNVFLASTSPERYLTGCTINHIELFYNYDKWLRGALLPILLSIENTIKAVVAYDFAEDFGAMGYFNIKSYSRDPSSQKYVEAIMKEVKQPLALAKDKKNTSDIRYDCIRHYQATQHNSVPIWVLFSTLTFGTISKFYNALQKATKDKIALHLSAIFQTTMNAKDLYTNLKIIVQARNTCAHNQRIYRFKPYISISSNNILLQELSKKNISPKLNSLDSLLISMAQLTTKETVKTFVCEYTKQLEKIMSTTCESIETALLRNINISIPVLQYLLKRYYR